VSQIAEVESQFAEEKIPSVERCKEAISVLRRDIRDIENAVSEFRTVLRKEEKIRRDQEKALRE
jgi:hypothetical protein